MIKGDNSDLLLRSLAFKTLDMFSSFPHRSPGLQERPISISLCGLSAGNPLSGGDNGSVLSVTGEKVAAWACGGSGSGRSRRGYRAAASEERATAAWLLYSFTLGRDSGARFNGCGFAVAEERHGFLL
jgi:hypothetical protein